MKNLFQPIQILFLLLFVACNSDDNVVPTGQPQPGNTLELIISAADFVTDGAPDTRATDDGNRTTFDEGDRVGVIILGEGGRLLYNNIPYVYNSGNWTFDSKNNEGKGGCYYDTKAATYIVYYPYSQAADGVTSKEDLKTKFAPKFNQSDIKDYRSSDLMVWDNSSLIPPVTALNAVLKHAFASICLAPTVDGVILDDGNLTRYTGSYASEVTDISDVSLTIDNTVYVPFHATDGSLRCIVPAGITPGDIRCFYTIGGKTYGNTIKISGTGEVVVNTRYACKPAIGDVTYSLGNAHVGDFYCKKNENEGYLIPGDVNLIEEQKTACIGIVFWVGDATAKDQTLKNDYQDCTHGLVVALRDAVEGTTVWQVPSSSVQSWLNNKRGVYLPVESNIGNSIPLNNIQGYNNTKAIEEFNVANGGNLVQAVVKVDEYGKVVSVPKNSSQWYLPSAKELTLLCGKDVNDIWTNDSGKGTDGTANKDLINGKLNSISSVATEISSAGYWSSTEDSSNSRVFNVYFDSGYVRSRYKADTYRVRCVLAF